MGFLDDILVSETPITAEFRNKEETFIDGTISSSYSVDPDLSVEGLFWVGRFADSVVSERLRADVEGVFVMDYEDYTTVIEENAKVTINSVDYSVIYIDDTAFQNELVQVPVKRFS